MMPESPIVILGGGLAGLSLAVQLVAHDVRRPITILEPRQHYTDDRTWCFWDTEPHPFADAVSHRWPRWRVTAAGESVTAVGRRYSYCRLPAGRVYDTALAILERAPQVTLLRGVWVKDVWPQADGRLVVVTDQGPYVADLAFDGRPPAPGSWNLGEHPFMWQDFLGWRIQAQPGSFDPERVDLMDFDTTAAPDIRFFYVLPLSDREALVESTLFTQRPAGQGEHVRHLMRDLDRRIGQPYAVLHSERGRIPMTTAPPPPAPHPHIIPIGTRAGAPRPSTGYAFLPIQRHSRALSAAVAAGRPPAAALRSKSTLWLDRVFLTKLGAAPEDAPALFRRLFAKVSSDRLVRFLSEQGNPCDHLAVMTALPAGSFLRAAWDTRPGPLLSAGAERS